MVSLLGTALLLLGALVPYAAAQDCTVTCTGNCNTTLAAAGATLDESANDFCLTGNAAVGDPLTCTAAVATTWTFVCTDDPDDIPQASWYTQYAFTFPAYNEPTSDRCNCDGTATCPVKNTNSPLCSGCRFDCDLLRRRRSSEEQYYFADTSSAVVHRSDIPLRWDGVLEKTTTGQALMRSYFHERRALRQSREKAAEVAGLKPTARADTLFSAVVCPATTDTLDEAYDCFRQAVCAGVASDDDTCVFGGDGLGAGGLSAFCPGCDNSKKGLYGLLGLLGIIPLVLCSLALLLCLICLRPRKAYGPPPPMPFPFPPPMCPAPMPVCPPPPPIGCGTVAFAPVTTPGSAMTIL